MEKLMKYNKYLYILLCIFIGTNIIQNTRGDMASTFIYMSLFFLILLNNYLRNNFFYKDDKKYYFSVFLYIALTIIINWNIGGYSDFFHFMIIYELIIFDDGAVSKAFIAWGIFNIIFLNAIKYEGLKGVLSLEFWRVNSFSLIVGSMVLFFYILVFYTIKALRVEKRKVEKLNKELESSYEQLMKQSEKIEELTISKERNRLAGEIHDILGHNLVALNMNLDVAEKILKTDFDKGEELIKNSKNLAKKSMESLRRAVYALKEEHSLGLAEKLKTIAGNIQAAGEIRVILDIDEEIEKIPNQDKDVIYTTIKESITNSIKHGKCNQINIDIEVEGGDSKIIVKDNGIGCLELVKGNGLIGIENRISELGGQVVYDVREGFKLEIML